MSTTSSDTEDTDARVVTLGGVLYTAAIDFTAEVCECSARDAATKLSNLRCHERCGLYVSKLLSRKHQFAGRGQQAIAVLAAGRDGGVAQVPPAQAPARRSAPMPRKRGFVYAGHSKGNGTKVGMTTRDDPKLRLRDANTYVKHPYELVDFIHCDDPAALEGFIHGELDSVQGRGPQQRALRAPRRLRRARSSRASRRSSRGGARSPGRWSQTPPAQPTRTSPKYSS